MSPKRLTAADLVRMEIDDLFADPERELGEALGQVALVSMRLVVETALEAEMTEFLGRACYGNGERARQWHGP